MSRTITVVTGSRAEYGLLTPLLKAIDAHDSLELQLLVTGMHLSPRHGNTIDQILTDGIAITATVNMDLEDDSALGIAEAMANGISGFCHNFQIHRPDILVVLGDRYEIFTAVQAAMICNIPIAHIHGGEASEGAMDEAIRHSITKMAQLHFTATESYRQRVIQLGEQPGHVFNVGALAVDNIRKLPLLDKTTLEADLGFRFGNQNFLVTYHPLTLDETASRAGITHLLEALDEFPDAHTIFTRANADSGGAEINAMIDRYVDKNPQRCIAFDAMGSLRYLSAMRLCDAVVGNSSSGIIEAPIMKTATVNIGDRQKGRLRVNSIIDVSTDAPAIVNGIAQALSNDFKQQLSDTPCIYGDGDTAGQIVDLLARFPLDGILMKRFYDLPGVNT